MKQLKLDGFKAEHSTKNRAQIDQLLGQVLGNCHDLPPLPEVPKTGEGDGT